MTDNNISDDQLSQFLAFTGSADPNVARQYLEMSGNQLEMAVSLFMDHNNNGGGSGVASVAGGMGPSGGMGGMGPMGSPNVTPSCPHCSSQLIHHTCYPPHIVPFP
eukprot:scaffold20905_cov200-Skeletonema_marinoi.AAC.1